MGSMERKNHYNIEELKAVRLEEILKIYGISVYKNGFFSIRNESVPSCKIYSKTNTYCDFGDNTGGNGINLIERLENCERMEAMDKLAQLFNIQPDNLGDKEIKIILTDNQYASIGIYGDMATKNMQFDLTKYSFETNKRRAEKYRMPMNELKEKYLYMYEAIIKTCAIPYVQQNIASYVESMKQHFTFRNLFKTVENLPISHLPRSEEIIEKYKEYSDKLNRQEKVLEIACKDCKTLKYKATIHDPVKEYIKMTEEIDLNGLYEILEDNPLWISVLEDSKRKMNEIQKTPQKHNDMDIKTIAKEIKVNIQNDRNNAREQGERER